MVKQIKNKYPQAQVNLWASDEHRVGLQPIIKRIWTPKGNKPTILVQQQYAWLYLYSFVCPENGENFWLLLPTVTAELFTKALEEFANYYYIGENNRVVLVLDQAGFHTGNEVKIPQGIHIKWLPAYSPELQPVERLWELTDETAVNKRFNTIEELEDNQAARCRQLSTKQETIKSRTLFHWWPIVGKKRIRN